MIGISALSEAVNPYLLYIKIALVAVVVGGLVWFGYHEKAIRADREKFKTEAELQKATAEMYARQFNDYITLNREIADAIKKVRVQSNTYIDSVEVSQPPVPDGNAFVLIPPGMPKAVPRVPGLQNYTSGRTSTSSP